MRHVGRVGLRNDGEGSEPLLVDWRAPAARPFYTATAVDPQGQARRRHIRTTGSAVVGVDDEPLDGSTTAELVGEGALLAALDQRRTGRMSTAISTLQREQDDIIRADATGPLIVQGGPGTGKTVVALHRVAYLLFTHRKMADQAVLVLGPSPRFLQYIAQVLPALGETAVVSATCDTLLADVQVGRDESRLLAEIKGRALWQPTLESYVTSLLPRPRELKLRWEGEFYVIPAATVAQALASAVQGRPYHRARAAFAEQLHHLLADVVAEQREALMDEMEEGFEDILARVDKSMGHDHSSRRTSTGSDIDGLLSEEEVEHLRCRIAENATIARFIEAWWPTLDAETLLGDLLTDHTLLARFAPQLSPEEITAVSAEPTLWASSDIPLLDALADLLGEVEHPATTGRVPRRPRAPPARLGVRPRRHRRGAGAVRDAVADGSPALSQSLHHRGRRHRPGRGSAPAHQLGTSGAGCFRRPLDRRGTHHLLPDPARGHGPHRTGLEEGWQPQHPATSGALLRHRPLGAHVTPAELAGAAVEAVRQLQQRWHGGTVGVIAPADRIATLHAVLSDVPVLTATQSKGLEWDATLLIDPQGIAAEPRGWNGLYVALTRCTQELGQLTLTQQSPHP